jgi:hypothetical protein
MIKVGLLYAVHLSSATFPSFFVARYGGHIEVAVSCSARMGNLYSKEFAMFHKKKNLAVPSFYINLENDKFLVACTRSEFNSNQIPDAFTEVQDGTFVLTIVKNAEALAVQRFDESLGALRHEHEIRQAFETFQRGQTYRPGVTH